MYLADLYYTVSSLDTLGFFLLSLTHTINLHWVPTEYAYAYNGNQSMSELPFFSSIIKDTLCITAFCAEKQPIHVSSIINLFHTHDLYVSYSPAISTGLFRGHN